MYEPLERHMKLADRAMLQLQKLIIDRNFAPGDRLPSEVVLGERLHVSRTVIREALRGLSIKGLVEVRNGAGAFVRSPSTNLLSELLGMCVFHLEAGDVTSGHILEVRRTLEIEIAGLAAQRHTPEHLAALEHPLTLMADPGHSAEEYARIDCQFHNALATASRNPLFPIMLGSILEVLVQNRVLAFRLPATRKKALYHHRRVFIAVKTGSVARSRAAMEAHLRETEHTLRLALRQLRTERKQG